MNEEAKVKAVEKEKYSQVVNQNISTATEIISQFISTKMERIEQAINFADRTGIIRDDRLLELKKDYENHRDNYSSKDRENHVKELKPTPLVVQTTKIAFSILRAALNQLAELNNLEYYINNEIQESF